MTTLTRSAINKYWQYALWPALFTIFYNFAEGLASIYSGVQDEALTLFGFGIDSFIEAPDLHNPSTPSSQVPNKFLI